MSKGWFVNMRRGFTIIVTLILVTVLAFVAPLQASAVAVITAGDEYEFEVDFSSSSAITALQVTYTLSSGLTFVSATCPNMTGKGSATDALFYSMDGVTSGTVYITVRVNEDVYEEQLFKVTAVTGANTEGTVVAGSAFSQFLMVQLGAPKNLHATAATAVSLRMGWNNVAGASHYRFYKDGVYIGNTTGNSYFVNNLDPDTVYGFKVVAVADDGFLGEYSENVYVRTTKVAAPAGLRASTVTSNSIKMFWNNAAGASYYRLYRNGEFIGKTTNLYYTSTTLQPDTVYSFKVVAVDVNGKLGNYSGYVNVRTQKGALAAPPNLRPAVVSSNYIKMFWDHVPGVKYYRFYRNGVYVGQTDKAYFTSTVLQPDTAYAFKVVAVDADGKLGEYSGNVFVKTPAGALAAPPKLRAAAITSNSIKMFWNTVPGASYYRFYCNGSYIGRTTNLYYTSTVLKPETTYAFKVVGVDANGDLGEYSSNVYIRTQAGALAAPPKLRSAVVTSNSIKMFWNTVPGASYYRFYRNGIYVGHTKNAYFTSTTLQPDTPYGFKVVAVDASGALGEYSGNVYVRTKAGQLASPPNLRPAVVTATSIKMFWDRVPGAAYYRFYRNGSYVGKTANAYFTSTILAPETAYGFKVVAVDANGALGEYSGNVYVTTSAGALAAPQNLHADTVSADLIKMTWDALPGASYYRFYRNGVYMGNTSGTVYEADGLDPHTLYVFKVVGVDAHGALGAYSKNVSVRTQFLAAPGNLRAATVTSNSIKMFWNHVSGASYYRFYRNGVYVGKTTNGYFTSTVLAPDTPYGFKVVAVDRNGTLGEYSANVYVRTQKGPLAAPPNLRMAAVTADSIKMFWNRVPGASHYRIYINELYEGETSNAYYTSIALRPDTVYSFKVVGVDANGDAGEYSGNVYVKTKPLGAPQNLRATAKATNSITMSWNETAGAMYYRVYRNGVYIANAFGTVYTSDNLQSNTVYGFKVAAVDRSDVIGPYSGNVYVRTQKLAAPANLRVASVTGSSIKMFWNTVEGASYYRFYLNGSYVGQTSHAYYTCTGLTADTVYGFKVVAVDADDILGEYSGNVYARTAK